MTSELHHESRDSVLFRRNEFLVIVFDILNEINEDAGIDSLCNWNLNHKQYILYVQFLQDFGLLEQYFKRDDSRRECVKITSRGRKFIKDYQRLKSLII